MSRSGKGYFFAIMSGLIYGIIPLAILSVSRAHAASSAFCLTARMVIGFLLLLPLALKRARTTERPPHCWPKTVVAALLGTATCVLLYACYEYIPSGIGITIHYLYPACCLLFNVIFFKEKVARATVIALILSVAGVALMCDPQALPEGAWKGLVLAFVSALCCGLTFLYLEKSGLADEDTPVYCDRQLLFSSIFLSAYVAFRGELHAEWSPAVIFCLIAAGVLGLIALLIQLKGIELVGADITTILATLEPITLAVGGVLLLGDKLSVRSWCGIAMVLTAVILITLAGKKKEEGTLPDSSV